MLLSRSTLMMLRRVLHAYREGWILDDRLATIGRMAAEDTHRLGLAAERMIIALKDVWAELDDVGRLPQPAARELLDRLVTLSIRAYYADGAGTRGTARPTLMGAAEHADVPRAEAGS